MCLFAMTERFTGLFTMKRTRNNSNVTSTCYRNGMKIGNFVFTLTNVRFYGVTHARDHTSYPYKLSGCMLQSVTKTVDLGDSLISNLSWKTQMQKLVNKSNKIVGFVKRNVGPGNKEDSFLVCTRPWLYPFWNMLTLSDHPIYRTLTLLNESNIGPQNTLSQCHLGTLCTMKDWQFLSGPVFNQGGLIYLC